MREEEQIAWLAHKGEQHGFRLLSTSVNPEAPAVQAAKQADEHGWRKVTQTQTMHLTFGAVLFTGYLKVTDADRFRTALEHGIGSGKAFGFGLLSIAAQ
ncbi:MAG: type I-E CRISPR-associated protein Cas6/Cse3/CasE [Roseiflexus sp.]|nr:type I-E CRISPR-associated protein Cas6/Cse3/CasE [Roseiflexus sp.]